MAAPSVQLEHHVKLEFCTTRPKYREGRQLKSVKVYTINDESTYVLVQGIPAVGIHDELLKLFSLNGEVSEHRLLKDYPSENFCDTLLVKFKHIQSARHAKKKLDDTNFYGGVLHICYAPEFESIQETRDKLQDRRRTIAWRKRKLDAEKKQLDEASQLSLPENNEDSIESSEKNETENISNLQFAQLEHNFGPRNPRHDPYRREHQPHSRDFFHGELTRNREQHHPLNPQSSHVDQQLNHHLQYSCVSDGNQYSPSRKELHQDFHDAATFRMLPNWNLPPVERTSKGWYPPDYDGRLRNPEPDKHFKKVESDANNKMNNTQGNIVIKELDSLKPVGKLIPRQVRKRKVLPEGLLGQVTKTTRDSVNEELRRTAFILGDVKGPSRAEFDEESFLQKSATGDKTMDDTVCKIRQKVQEFSALAPPPQLKRRKLPTKS